MKVRSRPLELNRVVADAETIVWNLRGNEPITAIEIRVNAERAAVAANTIPLLGQLPNLRLVDGSKNYQNAGMAKYLHGMEYGMGHNMSMSITSDNAAETAMQTVILYMGRYFGDKEFYFDPKKCHNPQLQMTSAITVGGNDYATGTLRYTIIIHSLIDQPLNHRGVLICKEVIADTVAALAEVQNDMPADYPWWALGVFNESAAKVPLHPIPTLDEIRLNVNNGQREPFDYQSRDLIMDNIRDLGLIRVVEEEIDDWAINLGIGLVPPNITLEAMQCAPYGGVFVPFHHIYRMEPLEFNINDLIRLVKTGGATGGVARVMLAQLADVGYFGT